MRALSVRQPWAWCIVHGPKRVENRSHAFKHRGRFLVHASKQLDDNIETVLQTITQVFPRLILPRIHEFQLGGVIGLSSVVDCVTDSKDPWAIEGAQHLVLGESKPLPFIPCRGALGFWEAPTSVTADVYRALQFMARPHCAQCNRQVDEMFVDTCKTVDRMEIVVQCHGAEERAPLSEDELRFFHEGTYRYSFGVAFRQFPLSARGAAHLHEGFDPSLARTEG